ncbi:MAG: response regulator transcription factor [Myxococcota bacterium]|nr:response regulator transcription factor [Myxococcota bacterium]
MYGGDAGRVALVDDEANIRETVGFALRRAGYRVDTYADGLEAWESFERELPDLVVLDILMPRLDGLELCRRLRARSELLPIIFVTSRDEELDRVLGLELGADDYLCKPFSVRELIARVKVLFRRLALARAPAEEGEPIRRVGPLALDPGRHEVSWKDRPIPLTVSEFRLLDALARRPGHVKSRGQLLQEAYPDDAYVSERTIDSHIKRMRRKFEETDPAFAAIETVYGLGYRYRERDA